MIRVKRVYEPFALDDGFRVLVERLWPRGVSKERGRVDLWLKDVAPSPKLRTWYAHDVEKWSEFRRRYAAELGGNPEVARLREIVNREKTVTFLYAARDEEHNSAKLLKGFVEGRRG
ncbi:MAG TPA: DUF488 family protein [Thermoanaerobaculia bacterium]|nr:DUF488 family protein [Thermoanaerobaculia bacterium]